MLMSTFPASCSSSSHRMMAFIIGLPVAQITLFCFAIGKDPVGLHLAVVNNELNNSMEPCIPTTGCEWSLLSCRYLHHLGKRTLIFSSYDSDEEARAAVEKGSAWAAITFPSNYSSSLMARIDDGRYAADWDVEFSEMKIVMDMSSKCSAMFPSHENNMLLVRNVRTSVRSSSSRAFNLEIDRAIVRT